MKTILILLAILVAVVGIVHDRWSKKSVKEYQVEKEERKQKLKEAGPDYKRKELGLKERLEGCPTKDGIPYVNADKDSATVLVKLDDGTQFYTDGLGNGYIR